jgi:hypothetical protein
MRVFNLYFDLYPRNFAKPSSAMSNNDNRRDVAEKRGHIRVAGADLWAGTFKRVVYCCN